MPAETALEISPPALSKSDAGWRGRKWLALVEFAAFFLVFVADWRHFIPFSKTPFLLILGWASLRGRRIAWRDVGLRSYRNWKATLLFGATGGVVTDAFQLLVTQPVLARALGAQPNLSDFQALHGNIAMSLLTVALAWTLAAFGEEMVYRGYVLNRMADVTGRTRNGWIVSVVALNIVFGLAHAYQGVTGVLEEGLAGLWLTLLYLGFGRNLAIPIVAHGVQDTIDVVLIYCGRMPGL